MKNGTCTGCGRPFGDKDDRRKGKLVKRGDKTSSKCGVCHYEHYRNNPEKELTVKRKKIAKLLRSAKKSYALSLSRINEAKDVAPDLKVNSLIISLLPEMDVTFKSMMFVHDLMNKKD